MKRHLEIKQGHNATLSDKVSEQPINIIQNADCATDKKGDERNVQPGFCYDLNGTSEYIDVPGSDIYSFTDGSDKPFSVSAWIKMDDATNFALITKGVYNTDGEWQMISSGTDLLGFVCLDESVANCYVGRQTAALTSYQGTWIHVVGTYDASGTSAGFKIYVNGVQSDSSNAESNPGSYVGMENLTHNIEIGKYGSTYADGRIHDVRVHNKELTQIEVIEVMNRKTSGSEIGWWKCEENAGTMSFDSSGQGSHGTITGATLSTFYVSEANYSFNNEVGYTEIRYSHNSAEEAGALGFPEVEPLSSSFSVDLIYRSAQKTSASHQIVGVYYNSTSPYWRVLRAVSNGRLYAQIRDDSGNAFTSWTDPVFDIDDGEWHWITVVWDRDNDRIFLYADGEERANSGAGDDMSAVTDDVSLLYNTGYPQRFYFGHAGYSEDQYIYQFRFSKIARTIDDHLNFYGGDLVEDADTEYLMSTLNDKFKDISGAGMLGTPANAPLTALVPRNENSPDFCAAGFRLQHTGRVKYNISHTNNNCVSADGSDDSIAFSSTLINNLTEWTIAYRFDNFSASALTFIVGGEAAKNLLMYYNTGMFAIRSSSAAYYIINISEASVENKYSTMVWRSDGTYVYLTIDGSFVGATKPDFTTLFFDEFLEGYPNNYNTLGKFWDLRVWKSDTGQAESLLYHDNEMTVMPDHWFPLNEGSGNIVYDIVGGETGLITNATLSTFWSTQSHTSTQNLQHGFTSALNFNGTDAYLSIPDADQTGLDFGTNDVTFEFFISTRDTSTAYILSKYSTSLPRYRLYITGGNVVFYLQTSTGSATITSVTDINDGNFHAVSIVLDRDVGASIYIDGVLDVQEHTSEWTNLSGDDMSNAILFSVGVSYYNSIWADFLNGTIHSVRVSAKARCLSEIKYVYENGFENDDDTVSLWEFPGLIDLSDSKNDLTDTNTEVIKIPADYNDLTKDVTGLSVQYPAGGHNNAECGIDFTGGVAYPKDIYKGYGEFNGTTSYVSVPDANQNNFGDDTYGDRAFSVSAWVYMTDATNFNIVGKYETATTREWLLYTDINDFLSIHIIDETTNGYLNISYNTAFTENEWTHVVFTYDASGLYSGINLYINGASVSATNNSSGVYGNMDNTGSDLWIGANYASYASGYIRDVRICAADLTELEIATEYKTNVCPQPESLNAEYNLYKDAYDSSSYRNTGTSTDLTYSTLTIPTNHTHGDVLESPMFCKYDSDSEIECTANGTMYVPSSVSYGTWEFDILKNSETYSTYVNFIHDVYDVLTANGYQFRIYNTEYVALYRVDAGTGTSLMQTAASAINLDQWYHITIVRNSTTDEYVEGVVGTLGVFIDGVLATATLGTNPVTDNTHTSSNYIVLDLYLGQKVKSFKVNGEIINYSKFIKGTGTYTITGSKQSNYTMFERGQVITRPIHRYTRNIEE